MRKSKKDAFTLMEMLAVIVIIGVILAIVIPSVSNIVANRSKKEYDVFIQVVDKATRTYIDQYRSQLVNQDSQCFNINYQSLIKEGLKENNIHCTGNIIIYKSNNNKQFDPKYYLTCVDNDDKTIHTSDPIPTGCTGFDSKFKMDYSIYTDSNHTQLYDGTFYTKNAYTVFESTSPYSSSISHYEYATSLDGNWNKISSGSNLGTIVNLKDYVGTVYVRSVDGDGNTSTNVSFPVKMDNTGPTFTTSVGGNYILKKLSIYNVKDSGIGTLAENAYSFDGGNTWGKETTREYNKNGNVTVCSRDTLGNRNCKSVVISGIDTMDPKVSVSVEGKNATFTFSDDMGIAGYGVNQSSTSEPQWIASSNTVVPWTATSAGTYYVWVKDVAGKIGKAVFTISQSAFCAYPTNTIWEYNYTGGIQTFAVPCNGTYKLETFGAQGGSGSEGSGGNGGYSSGTKKLNKNTNIYIAVGGKGANSGDYNTVSAGGYNGGGNGYASGWSGDWRTTGGGGGGATHIATTNRGVLSNYSANISELLLVAGGGGGSHFEGNSRGCSASYNQNGKRTYYGGSGGGNNSGTVLKSVYVKACDSQPTTTKLNCTISTNFGRGMNYNDNNYTHCGDDSFSTSWASGGGGGYYGGRVNAGGSGYVGGVDNGSMENGQRSGNGYAKITLVSISD